MGGASTFSRLTRRFVPVLLVGAVLGAAVCFVPAGAAPAENSKASIDLDQCRNGAAASPNDCVDANGGGEGWVNGNAGTSQAHYAEGLSIPYRAVMADLPTGTPITVTLGYSVKHSDAHSIDFLTTYDRLEPHAGYGHLAEDIEPTDGVTGISATIGTFDIPAPSFAGSPVPGQPTAAFNALPAAERKMTLFGGTITGMAYVSQGDLNASNSDTLISVTFTADSASAVLSWGGHIGEATVWGEGNSASGINGSPYHMRLDAWTLGNLGNTDRSLSAGAVIPVPEPPVPASLTVTKVVSGGSAVVGDFDLFVDQTQVTSGQANEFAAGSYIVSEGDHDGYVSTISGDCAAGGSITLSEGEVAACTITNDDIDPQDPPVDPQDPPVDPEDPVTPVEDPEVESNNQTQNPNTPVEVAMVTVPPADVPKATTPLTIEQAPVSTGDELPRTGAGLREETLLGLLLMLAGLLARGAGRRNRPSDI
ncbi:MAG: hypothetical protein ACRDZ7_10750 [Acidimicrobiia bacterium]